MRRLAPKLALLFAALALVAFVQSPRPSPLPTRTPLQSTPDFSLKQLEHAVNVQRWRDTTLWFDTVAWNEAQRREEGEATAAIREQSQHVAHYDGDVWSALAQCESGMTNADTGNGFYGYFQFVPSTWRSLGYEGLPTAYGYETQREAAIALQARSGWGQWPACSRKLGLR